MNFKARIITLLALLTCLTSFAQDNAEEVGKYRKFLKDAMDIAVMDSAEFFFKERNYDAAILRYEKLSVKYPKEEYLLYKIGVAELNLPDGFPKALDHFSKIDIENYHRDHSLFYYGRALMMNYKFQEAIDMFKKYMEDKWSSFEKRAEAEKFIVNCQNGINLMLSPVEVTIENMGQPINSKGSEYVPLINTEGTVMIFTYRGPSSIGGLQRPLGPLSPPEGEYYEDIVITTMNDSGKWMPPRPISGPVNSLGNDACIFLSDDGSKLYLFKSGEEDEGAIYISRLDGITWGPPEKLYGKINSPWWEGSICFSADGRIAIFSSERPGGFGGRDLYSAVLQADGSWGDVRNLGPNINTPGDDDAPFLHPSGEFMIYSSTGHNSMGGYDIYRSELIQDSTWSVPANAGYPINTPGDDKYYVITGDGQYGYYSSGKAGGLGAQDIYRVAPGLIGKKVIMVQVKGTVTLDDQPVNAEVKVTYSQTGVVQGMYSSNSVTGKYLVNFSKGRDLTLTFSIPGYPEQKRKISTMAIDTFYESTIDVQFYSDAYTKKLNAKKDSLVVAEKISVTPEMKQKINKAKELSREEILSGYGDQKIEGLIFRVQIGAFRIPQNFDYTRFLKLGQVYTQRLNDGITRFTIGEFATIREAYTLVDEALKAGLKGAFITAEYKGKRYYIQELIAMNFQLP